MKNPIILKVEVDSRFKEISACIFFVGKEQGKILASFPEPQILLSYNPSISAFVRPSHPLWKTEISHEKLL